MVAAWMSHISGDVGDEVQEFCYYYLSLDLLREKASVDCVMFTFFSGDRGKDKRDEDKRVKGSE